MQEESKIKAGMPTTEMIAYINERSQNIARYSDKLSKAIDAIQKYFRTIGPICGVRYISPDPFYTDLDDDYKRYYHLAVESYNGSWGLKIATFDSDDCDAEWTSLHNADHYGRAIKRDIIKALPAFLDTYMAELARLEKEYEDISEKAAQIAAILS